MGYSCNVKAEITLRAIQQLDEFTCGHADYKYFADIGKENRDGAITGTVYEITGPLEGMNRACRKAGSFRINPDGSITRFPGVSKRMFGALHIHCIETYDRMYPPLRWGRLTA